LLHGAQAGDHNFKRGHESHDGLGSIGVLESRRGVPKAVLGVDVGWRSPYRKKVRRCHPGRKMFEN